MTEHNLCFYCFFEPVSTFLGSGTISKTSNVSFHVAASASMLHSVFLLSFRLSHFDGLIPFDFKTELSESNSKYLGKRV